MNDLKQTKGNTPSDLALSFDHLAASYTNNLRAIKARLSVLERGFRSSRTSHALRGATSRRGVQWDNLTLLSPVVGTSIKGQLTGLGTSASDLGHLASFSQS
jgi:hypothetical protein